MVKNKRTDTNLHSYTDKALKLFSQRFHCSQAVLAAFSKELGITEEQALKLGACFGGGMCRGEVCGACTGALMALGLQFGQCEIGDVERKEKTNGMTVRFLETFANENGSYMCRELLGCDLSTDDGKLYAREHQLFTEFCPKMVASATEIAGKLLLENR